MARIVLHLPGRTLELWIPWRIIAAVLVFALFLGALNFLRAQELRRLREEVSLQVTGDVIRYIESPDYAQHSPWSKEKARFKLEDVGEILARLDALEKEAGIDLNSRKKAPEDKPEPVPIPVPLP